MNKRNQILITVTIVIIMTLCGCSRRKNLEAYRENGSYDGAVYFDDYEYEMAGEADMMPMMAAEESVSYSKAIPSSANTADTSSQKRMVRKSASINIQVMDPIQAAEAIIAETERMGGFVVSSSNTQDHYSGDIYLPKANLSIRVPSEYLQEMLDFIEGQTTDKSKYVSNKKIFGVDITSDYVDTNSRLSSLEKTRDKLYEIMDTAENAEEALEVYTSIADVESEIEVLKGQVKYMEESVALSSIEIVVNSIKPAPIDTVQKWEIGEVFKDAFESLLDAGKSVIEFLIYFVIVIIPILILIAIPIVLVFLLIRKLIRRRKAKGPKNSEKSEDVLVSVKKD